MKVDKDRVAKFLANHPLLALLFLILMAVVVGIGYLLLCLHIDIIPDSFIDDVNYIVDKVLEYWKGKKEAVMV